MTIHLLPPTFDPQAAAAVRAFWAGRTAPATGAQGGSRDGVTRGNNMNGFVELVRSVALHCGLPAEAVHTRRAAVSLPGYFRATKSWDVLVIHRRRLVAVFEFKSQVGSFGNNFNNRAEEVIGAAADLWVAHHHGAYTDDPDPTRDALLAREPDPLLNPEIQRDPRPPFLAWLMLLEASPRSLAPVRADAPHYPVFSEFHQASYATRHQILCQRLVERQLYGAAALLLSEPQAGAADGAYRSLSDATSLRALFTEFGARAAAAAA